MQWTSTKVTASPGRYCPLLLPVQHCCPRVKGPDHLFDHFIKKQTGQMTVQERFELKGNLQKTRQSKSDLILVSMGLTASRSKKM